MQLIPIRASCRCSPITDGPSDERQVHWQQVRETSHPLAPQTKIKCIPKLKHSRSTNNGIFRTHHIKRTKGILYQHWEELIPLTQNCSRHYLNFNVSIHIYFKIPPQRKCPQWRYLHAFKPSARNGRHLGCFALFFFSFDSSTLVLNIKRFLLHNLN